MAEATTTAPTPAVTIDKDSWAVLHATDPSKLTIPQFASEIRKRKQGYDAVPDDVLVREVLARRPDYTKYIQTAQPRTKMKERTDRTPTTDQRMQKFFENHPMLREGLLGAASGLGIPESEHPVTDMAKGLVHTVTDKPKTKDEIASVAVGLPLPVYRVVKGIVQQTYGYGQEAFDAVDWQKFWQTAKQKGGTETLPQIFGEALRKDESGRQVGGEKLVHASAGLATMIASALVGGKKAPEAVDAAAKAGKGAAETGTVTAQRMAGTGPALAEKTATGMVEDVAKHNADAIKDHTGAVEKHATATEKVTDHNAAATAKYNTEVEHINQDFDQKVAEAKQKYADNVAERDKKVAEIQGQHAEKVAQARAQWVQKAYEARQAGREAAKVAARREALEHGQKAYTRLVDENVKATHKAVRGALDERWNGLREKVGVDAPVEAPPLYNAVESGRAMLAGVPADLKLFNDIIKEVTEKDTHVENEQGELKAVPKESITFDDARTQYSAIGEKAYAAEGNLRRALFTLYDAYDKALSGTAEKAGQGKEYSALKGDWKQYMQDWHDMRGEATGGSPLARLYRAVDDPVVAGKVLGKFGDRLMQTYARYAKYGASPTLMSKLRQFNTVSAALPKVRVPAEPGRLVPPSAPAEPPHVAPVEPKVADIEADRAKRLERTDKPVAKPLPEAPAAPDIKRTPTVDEVVAKVREAKAEKAKSAKESALTPGRHDAVLAGLSVLGVVGLHNIAYAIPYTVARFGEAALVSSELGQRWLSSVTPRDIQVINEVLAKTPEERASVSKAIADALTAKAKSGQKLPPLSTFQSLLDKAQMGAILRVVAPPVQQQQSQSKVQQSANPAP